MPTFGFGAFQGPPLLMGRLRSCVLEELLNVSVTAIAVVGTHQRKFHVIYIRILRCCLAAPRTSLDTRGLNFGPGVFLDRAASKNLVWGRFLTNVFFENLLNFLIIMKFTIDFENMSPKIMSFAMKFITIHLK